MKNQEPAINIPQECADVYYENFDRLPSDLKKKLSFHELSEIFLKMAIPAIDHARFVDRHGYSNRSSQPSAYDRPDKTHADVT